MLRKNQLLNLTCDALGADMEGVCRADGEAVFVPGLLPGETATVRIVKEQKRFAFGRMESRPSPVSSVRRQPDCPAWPRCGGCTCRHMTYAATLEAKRQQVAGCFARIAHIPVEVPPVLGMDTPDSYRNKTALPFGGTPEAPVCGFFAPRSHTIIPAEGCPNAMAPSGDIAREVLRFMREHRIAPYVEETHTGLMRHLVVRVNRRGQAMVTLVINGDTLPFADELAERLAPLGMVSLGISVNTERTNVIFGRTFRTLYGPEVLEDTLCGLQFRLSAAAFFQVNPAQTEALYRTALDFAAPGPQDLVCDVYCGAGTISLLMAQRAGRVLGIEIVAPAVENARENARLNHVTNAEFRTGAAEALLPQLVKEGLRPDIIVVDPPRKGLERDVADAIGTAQPKRIVYVSCNVATQARDAAWLCEYGYRVDRVQPVDMFCWTSGVENVIALSRP